MCMHGTGYHLAGRRESEEEKAGVKVLVRNVANPTSPSAAFGELPPGMYDLPGPRDK
jgi:hypothetical protein